MTDPKPQTTQINLSRKVFTDKSTIGELYVSGVFFCHTLELSCRRGDEKGLRAIPAGTYRLNLDPSPKYGKLMWEIFGVPGRSGILIHPANRPEELDGCIAPGVYDPNLPDWVYSSTATYRRLCERLNEFKNQQLWISLVGGLRSEPESLT